MLSSLMVSFSISIAHGFVPELLEDIGLISNSISGHKIGDPTQLLFGPFFYLYVLFLSKPATKYSYKMLLHFIPSLVLAVFSIIFGKHQYNFTGSVYASFWFLILLQMWGYISLVHRLIAEFRNHIKNRFSDIDKINLGWISFGTATLSVAYSINIIFIPLLLHNNQPFDHFDKGVTLILALTVYGFGYKGLTQRSIFIPALPENDDLYSMNKMNEAENKNKEKYKKSVLTNTEIEQNLTRLDNLMAEKRPYLDPELTAAELSELSGLTIHHLSEIINRGTGKNFYDYINTYRTVRFIDLLKDKELRDNNTLLALAFDAGFNSKATFNKFFKQMTGKTPLQYKKEIS